MGTLSGGNTLFFFFFCFSPLLSVWVVGSIECSSRPAFSTQEFEPVYVHEGEDYLDVDYFCYFPGKI